MLRRSSVFKNVLPVAAVAATMAWAGAANASIILDANGNVEFGIQKKAATDDFGNLDDTKFVSNIYVRFSELDDRLLSIGFSNMFTKNGSNFFQHPLGGNTAPNAALFDIPGFMAVRFDTFVTIGVKSNDGSDATATDFDYLDIGNKISGGWFADPDSGQGDASNGILKEDGNYWVLVAQLTIVNKPDNGVAGSMIVFWQEAPGQAQQQIFGSFDNQVPSPGALALLGLAGLVGAHRRRRR